MQTISTILQVLPYGTRYTDRFGADQMMPRFIAGVRAKIDFELRGPAGEGDELPPYDVQTMVNGATSFFFALDGDYDHTTTPKLLRQSGISVTYDDDGYGTIHAELPPTAQDGIIQYLRTSESIVLIGEIGGLDDNLEKIFSLPVTVQVTNPVWLPGETSSQDTPSPSDPDYLTAAQVRAYVVSQVAAQLEDAMEQVAKGDPGDKGDKGDPPTLAIGTVEPGTLGAEIEPATDEHGDDIPGSYILNLTIPDSASPVINIGTVTDGETPSAGIELEEDGSYTLSLTLPRGQMGTGIQPLADAWSESTAYSIYQAVRHNGAWWYSLQDGNVGHEPPATREDTAYWKLIVQDGRDGVTPVFSFNPSTDSPSSDAWHEPPYLATDKYFRLSLDGGFTWGVAMPMAMPSVPIVFQYNPTADGDWAEPTAASSSAQYSTVYGKYMRARNSVSGWGQAIYVLGLDEDNLQRDAQDLRIRFAQSVNDDWHATLQEGDAAVQIANASGTILQTYTFSLNAGETLDSVEFSPYEDPWHSPVTENDYYLRISPDGGTTFSDPILLRATNVPTGEGTSADLSNYYTKSQVDTRLANKAPSTHTHTKSQITDFAHAHVPSDITGLAAAFANKQDVLPSGDAGKFLKKTANGVEWSDAPSGSASVDLSNYYTKPQADTLLASKLSAPSGGSTGQFLKKTANGVGWSDVTASDYDPLYDRRVVSPVEITDIEFTLRSLIENMPHMCPKTIVVTHDCGDDEPTPPASATDSATGLQLGHVYQLTLWGGQGNYDGYGHATPNGTPGPSSGYGTRTKLVLPSSFGAAAGTYYLTNGVWTRPASGNAPAYYIGNSGWNAWAFAGWYAGPDTDVAAAYQEDTDCIDDGPYYCVANYSWAPDKDGGAEMASALDGFVEQYGTTEKYPLTPEDAGLDPEDEHVIIGVVYWATWLDITPSSPSGSCGCPPGVEIIADTRSAAGAAWTGVTEDAELADGKLIVFTLAYASASNATLELTLGGANGQTTTGAKPIYMSGDTRLGTDYVADNPVLLSYKAAANAWYVVNRYKDTNSNTYDRTNIKNGIYTGSTAVAASSVCVYSPTAGGFAAAAAGMAFAWHKGMFYCQNGANANVPISSAYSCYGSSTSFANLNGATPAGAAGGKPVYLVGTYSSGLFTIGSELFTCVEPSTADGKVYALVGYCHGTGYTFVPQHELLAYYDGAFQPWNPGITLPTPTPSVPSSFTLSTPSSYLGLAGTWTLVEGTTTEYNGDTYPVYQNGSQYLAMRSDGKPHINSSADVSQTSLWRPDVYTQGAEMTASNLSGEWNNPNDDWDATFTFTET